MKNVVVYSKPNCMQCEMTKKELKKLSIDFILEDLTDEKNAQLLEDFKSKGHRSAPITVVGDVVISGFNPVALKNALGM